MKCGPCPARLRVDRADRVAFDDKCLVCTQAWTLAMRAEHENELTWGWTLGRLCLCPPCEVATGREES